MIVAFTKIKVKNWIDIRGMTQQQLEVLNNNIDEELHTW